MNYERPNPHSNATPHNAVHHEARAHHADTALVTCWAVVALGPELRPRKAPSKMANTKTNTKTPAS